jgi:hypothetical protein
VQTDVDRSGRDGFFFRPYHRFGFTIDPFQAERALGGKEFGGDGIDFARFDAVCERCFHLVDEQPLAALSAVEHGHFAWPDLAALQVRCLSAHAKGSLLAELLAGIQVTGSRFVDLAGVVNENIQCVVRL